MMFFRFKNSLWQEKVFIFCILISAFLISCEYGITRPACNSIFISSYTSSFIPYAWVAAVPLNFLVIYLYNRFLPLIGCWKTFFIVQLLIVSINVLGGFSATSIIWFPFFQAIWKDVYILLMFKQLWSLIHTSISASRAKFLYGIIAGFGGIGSVVGGMIAHQLAIPLGSQNLFFFTLPLYLLLLFFYSIALFFSKMDQQKGFTIEEKVHVGRLGFSLIRNSRTLTFLLCAVVFMQLSISLIDFQFNLSLEQNFPDTDVRTKYYGQVIAIINLLTAIFQFCGGLVLVHFFGLKKCHLFLPVFLLCNGMFLLFTPAFALVSYALISIKTLDYSIFLIIREMLYIPLKVDEKFRAKAIIDVFAYRGARALGSFLILCLQFFSCHLSQVLSIVSMAIFICWFFSVWILFKPAALVEEKSDFS